MFDVAGIDALQPNSFPGSVRNGTDTQATQATDPEPDGPGNAHKHCG